MIKEAINLVSKTGSFFGIHCVRDPSALNPIDPKPQTLNRVSNEVRHDLHCRPNPQTKDQTSYNTSILEPETPVYNTLCLYRSRRLGIRDRKLCEDSSIHRSATLHHSQPEAIERKVKSIIHVGISKVWRDKGIVRG